MFSKKNNNFNLTSFIETFNKLNNFISNDIQYIENLLNNNLKKNNKCLNDLFGVRGKTIKKYLTEANIYHIDSYIEFQGGYNKYEISDKDNYLYMDRIFASKQPNIPYGYINNTLAGDGDPLDIFILTPHYLTLNHCVTSAIPLLSISLTDDGEKDEKVIGILSSALPYFFTSMKKLILTDLYSILSSLLESNYFGKTIILEEILNLNDTIELIEKYKKYNRKI